MTSGGLEGATQILTEAPTADRTYALEIDVGSLSSELAIFDVQLFAGGVFVARAAVITPPAPGAFETAALLAPVLVWLRRVLGVRPPGSRVPMWSPCTSRAPCTPDR